MALSSDRLTTWLRQTNSFWFSLYAASAAFCLYTCIYTFRKAFSVATFDELYFMGVSYKVWLVTSQVIGYALSKFIGIKVIAELQSQARAKGILLMSFIACISLLCFAIVPPPYNIIFLFTNGLPLGMVWGMIFSYLEGRKVTEVLGAGLSVSFIFSSGFAKSVGGLVMREWGVSEFWMPFVTCMMFIAPLLFFLWLLENLPPPSALDEHLRTKRKPMNGKERKIFITTFLPGIALFIIAYMLLTAYRDFRDNFSAELWTTLGYGNSPEIFTITEIPVSIAVLVIMGSVMLIKNNKLALMVNHYLIITGLILIGASTLLFQHGVIAAPIWMIITGLGLYLGYVPFNSIFFDRLIAAFQYAGTVGFIMYVADSFGYLASVGVMFVKEFGFGNVSWLNFFIKTGYVLSIAGTLFITGSLVYFHQKHREWKRKVVKTNDMLSTTKAALPEVKAIA